jgi:hypothetical protein
LVVVEIGDKNATGDVHVFGVNPWWSRNLKIRSEAGVIAKEMNSKTSDKGTTMMFVGYKEHESESIRMCDPSTEHVVVSAVTWLRCLFYQMDVWEVLEPRGELEVIKDNESQIDLPVQPWGTVMWKDLLVTEPTRGVVMHSCHAIKPLEHPIYSSAVKLHYLGEITELDHEE